MSRKLLSFIFMVVPVLLLGAPAALAQDPAPISTQAVLGTTFTYQGQIKQNGSPVNGACDLRFKMWDALSGGAQVGTTQTKTNVPVQNGNFVVDLNFGNIFDGNARWLESAVRCPAGSGSYTTLSPRKVINAVPYALYAKNGLPPACASDQVVKWNGSAWTCANDNTGSGGSGGWSLTGNAGTNPSSQFLGTTDNVTLTLRANNQIGWRLQPASAGSAPNIIGGYSGNIISSAPDVFGATIGGGGASLDVNRVTGQYGTVGGGWGNSAGVSAFVGGGYRNQAANYAAFVGGGNQNQATNWAASVGGGAGNQASGILATIPGGQSNVAQGYLSFAAGYRANALHDGAFVWGDRVDADIASTAANQFIVRATGGTRFYGLGYWDLGTSEGDFRIGSDAYRLKIGVAQAGGGAGDVWLRPHGGTNRMFIWTPGGLGLLTNEAKTAGVQLAPGAGAWSSLSDRNAKTNFAAVEGRDILDQLARLPISTWNYRSQATSIRHLGPTAQDFYAIFGLGEDDTHISTVDADGVALAAIQGLYQLVQTQEDQLAHQQVELDALKARLAALEQTGNTSAPAFGWRPDWLALAGLAMVGLVVVKRRNMAGGGR